MALPPAPSPGRRRRPRLPAASVLPGAAVKPTRVPSHRRPHPPAVSGPAVKPASGYNWNGSGGHSISLTAHKKHVAAHAADNNPLYDPSVQLSGNALKTAAGDLVNLEYGPQRAALERELANTTTQGTALTQRAADYSGQIAQNDATLVPQVNAIGDELLKKLAGNNTEATTAIGDTLTATQQRAAADQTLRGMGDTGLENAGAQAESQKQLDQLAANTQTSKDAAAAQTSNYAGLAAISGQARAQMGQEVQGQLLNRLANNQADVRARQADLASSEGAATSKATTDLRQQGFENLMTQLGLNIKKDDIKAQSQEAQDRLDEQAKSRRQRARDARANRSLKRDLDKAARADKANAINSVGIKNSEWLKMSDEQRQNAVIHYRKRLSDATRAPKDPKDPKPPSQSSIDKGSRVDSMLTDIRTDPKLQRHVGEPGPRLTQILVNRGADPLEAQAAAEIAKHKKLTPATKAALVRAGVTIPPEWG